MSLNFKSGADVLLMHFGGPTKEEEVREFLFNLFNDPLILRIPGGDFARKMLAKFISSRRWPKTNEQYKKIGYSPINKYTDIQAKHLEKLIKRDDPEAKVFVINRYTAPRASEVIHQIKDRYKSGRRLFIATLYPHFSHSTAGSSIREFDLAWRDSFAEEPPISARVFAWWWHKSFLEYSFELIQESIDQIKAKDPKAKISVIYSAHGLPKKYSQRGDPYIHDIRAHTQRLTARLSANSNLSFYLGFQSRVGPVEWIRPYTDELIDKLGKENSGTLLLVPISFVSDHIETLFEMDIEYKHLAMKSGFTDYARSRMPNEDPKFAQCLFEVLQDYGL